MIDLATFSAIILASSATFFIYQWKKQQKANPRNLPYPPGPNGYPLLGSYFSIPTQQHWLGFKKMSEEHGDMVFVKSLGMNYLVLNSMKRITDLLEKRSANYSDRGHNTMLMDLMSWKFNFAFQPCNDWWKRQRKHFHDYFSPIVIDKYDNIQTTEVNALLKNLLETPEDFQEHIPLTFAGIAMKIAYGIDIPRNSKYNPFLVAIRTALCDGLAVAGIPGMHLVDHFPILRHLPYEFPGAAFQKFAQRARVSIFQLTVTKTFNVVKHALEDGHQNQSMVADQLNDMPYDPAPEVTEDLEMLVKNVAGVSYAAGADAMASTIQGFFLAMAMFPVAQKKAQAEIDAITHGARLPTFQDRPSMPYMEAMILELMRWHTVNPLAIPHVSTEDDFYDGYFIPKGTVVIPNVWSVLNDPAVFPNPETFDPERYIKNPNLRNPNSVAFGFGRRACPGRFMSNRNMFAVMSAVLSVYDISPATDDNGNQVPLKYTPTTGLVSYPNDFACRIVPRSASAKQLIMDAKC